MKRNPLSKIVILAVFALLFYRLSEAQVKLDSGLVDSLAGRIAVKLAQLADSSAKMPRVSVFIIQKTSEDSIIMSIDSARHQRMYFIDSAYFKINYGRLISTYFYLKDSSKKHDVIFCNNTRLPLLSKHLAKKINNYKLDNNSENKEEFLLSRYFQIYPDIRFKSSDFYLTDTAICFVKNAACRKSVLTYQPGVEQYIEFDILSDILGLSEESPNGLIQFEGKASLTVNRRYLLKSNLRFVYNSIPFIQFNKIDNNNRYLPLLSDSAGNQFLNTLNLWQYSNLTVGAKLNLIRWDTRNYRNIFFLDATAMVIRTSITDSLADLKNFNVNSFIWGLSFKHRVQPIPNVHFHADFSLGLCYISLLSNNIRQQSETVYGPGLTPSNIPDNVENNKLLFVPQIELSFRPAKTNYFVRFTFPSDFKSGGNNFLRIQFGISLSWKELNNYLKFKE